MKGTRLAYDLGTMIRFTRMRSSLYRVLYGKYTTPSESLVRFSSIRWKGTDSKHYFTDPKTNEAKTPPTFFQQGQSEHQLHDVATAVGDGIRQHRRRRQRIFFSAMITGVIGVMLGVTIGYEVMYQRKQSFIPLFPSRKWHRLSAHDAERINIDEMKMLGKMRCLSILTNHEMIREQFGIPLKTKNGEVPVVKSFEVWCEDQEPGVRGIVLRPLEKSHDIEGNGTGNRFRLRNRSVGWHTVPGLFQWRLGTRPIKVKEKFDKFLKYLGLGTGDLLEVMNPEAEYGEFKHEFPLRKVDTFDGEDDRPMHIWFFGEMDLSDDAMVVFKGKYHVHVRMSQVDLLKQEKGQLVRYVLYKDQNEKQK